MCRLIKYQDINKYPLGYFIYSAQRNLPKEWLTYFGVRIFMAVVEKDKTLREIQDEVAALRIAFGYLGCVIPRDDALVLADVITVVADHQGFDDSVKEKLKHLAEQLKGNALEQGKFVKL